jgi:RNA polymerase sigma-70 factor (ECF subfamily)
MQLTRTADGDRSIVSSIAAGDQAALEAAYRDHAHAVMGSALKVGRDRNLAEDVVQEVFLRLWRRPDRFDPDRGSLRTFLTVDAQGRALDLVRSDSARRDREDREGVVASSDQPTSTEDQVVQSVLSSTIRDLLGHLRPEERDPIALAYLGGHSYREVARLLDRPEGTVKSRIRAGLDRLESLLIERGIDTA